MVITSHSAETLATLPDEDRDEFLELIVRFASRFTSNNPEALGDIANEVIFKVFKGGNPLPKHPSSYVFNAVRNQFYSKLRKRQSKERAFDYLCIHHQTYHEPDFLGELAKKELIEMVYEEIENLPLKYREVIVAKLEDKSNKEIAEEIGTSVQTVKNRYRRATKRLRIELENIKSS